jgi:hypothetical protein
MKKIIFVFLVVAIAASMATAQIISGNTAYIPTTDVQGAHEIGGRGCAGCHAPHSGGRGSGGDIIGLNLTAGGVTEGDAGLWGTDTAPIEAGYGGTIVFDTNFPVSLSGLVWSSGALYQGVATCLSCHDGNVSKGAMMSGQAYEQSFGLLNFATNAGSNHQAAPVNLYGSLPIPTLLGNDTGVAGDYANDHPIGPLANLAAVANAALSNGLIVTVAGNKATITVTVGTTYAQFVSNYGIPAIQAMAVTNGDTTPGDVYVVCTTCHNQHVQNVFVASTAVPIAGLTKASFATIFYVNAPYNPGAPYDPAHVPSTNRFCLQCHFDHSSEFFGATTVGTAF